MMERTKKRKSVTSCPLATLALPVRKFEYQESSENGIDTVRARAMQQANKLSPTFSYNCLNQLFCQESQSGRILFELG